MEAITIIREIKQDHMFTNKVQEYLAFFLFLV